MSRLKGTFVRILVTNDDGIESVGIHVLARHLTTLGAVTVFCPTSNFSGAGAAIGHIGDGLPDIVTADRSDLGDVEAAFHFDGPPALATMLVCKGIFGPPPDIVVSGINPGWNVGHAVHASGTVGACIVADVFGISSVAVSQPTADAGPLQHWDTAAQVATSLAEELTSAAPSNARSRLLNVNVPNVDVSELKGHKYTTLAPRLPYSLDAPTLTAKGDGTYSADFERFGPWDSSPGSDTHAVEAGHVSITPLTPTHAST